MLLRSIFLDAQSVHRRRCLSLPTLCPPSLNHYPRPATLPPSFHLPHSFTRSLTHPLTRSLTHARTQHYLTPQLLTQLSPFSTHAVALPPYSLRIPLSLLISTYLPYQTTKFIEFETRIQCMQLMKFIIRPDIFFKRNRIHQPDSKGYQYPHPILFECM